MAVYIIVIIIQSDQSRIGLHAIHIIIPIRFRLPYDSVFRGIRHYHSALVIKGISPLRHQSVRLRHIIALAMNYLRIALYIVIAAVQLDQSCVGLYAAYIVIPDVAILYDAIAGIVRQDQPSLRIKFIGSACQKPVVLADIVASSMDHLILAVHIIIAAIQLDQPCIGLHAVYIVIPDVTLLHDAVQGGIRPQHFSVRIEGIGSRRQQTIGLTDRVIPALDHLAGAVHIIVFSVQPDQSAIGLCALHIVKGIRSHIRESVKQLKSAGFVKGIPS